MQEVDMITDQKCDEDEDGVLSNCQYRVFFKDGSDEWVDVKDCDCPNAIFQFEKSREVKERRLKSKLLKKLCKYFISAVDQTIWNWGNYRKDWESWRRSKSLFFISYWIHFCTKFVFFSQDEYLVKWKDTDEYKDQYSWIKARNFIEKDLLNDFNKDPKKNSFKHGSNALKHAIKLNVHRNVLFFIFQNMLLKKSSGLKMDPTMWAMNQLLANIRINI